MVQPTFKDYVSQLKRAPRVLATPSEVDWKAHVEAISVPGQTAPISEGDFYYWLEVLPPRWQRGSYFCFAEGEEAFRFFWQEGESYFVRQLTRDETLLFCNLAGIQPPNI